MRRFRRIILIFFTLLILGVLTSPWWIVAALRPLLTRNGVTFVSSETNGYTRLVLNGLNVTTPAADITAARVELDTPWLLLWRRAFSAPGSIAIDDYAVTLKSAPPPASAAPDTSPAGVLPTRDLVKNLRSQIAPWLPALTLTRGKINLTPDDPAPITIDTISIRGDKNTGEIDIANITANDRTAEAKIAFTPAAITLDATATIGAWGTHHASISIEGDAIRANLNAFQQTATLTARFAPAGWLPAEAFLDAPALSFNASQLAQFKLPRYNAATGNARIEYRDARLTADITARAEALPETPPPNSLPNSSSPAPPIDIALHAQGTPDQIDITKLDLTIPGLTAKLSSPVTVTRDLRLLTPSSRFTLSADLAQQPWIPNTAGRLTGEITLATAQLDQLRAEARLAAENIRIDNIAVARLSLDVTQDNHLTRLNALDIALPDGSKLNAAGQYDTAARTLSQAKLIARILPGALAPWLPAGITFENAALDITAEGPDTAPAHKGSLAIKKFRAPGLANPADLSADWAGGRALAADTLNLNLSAAATEIRLAAADLAPDRVTLSALTLRKDNTDRLVLAAPATCTRTPGGGIILTPLVLSSPDNISKLSVQAAIAAPDPKSQTQNPRFQLALAAAGIDSALFSDLADTGPLPWHIASAEISAALPAPDAPLTAALSIDARLDYAQTLPNGAQDALELPDSALINASATLTPEGLAISHITIGETNSRSIIAHIAGNIPLTIRPAAATPLLIDKNAPLSLDAHTQPDSPFWQNLAHATGITLESPQINARLTGTPQKPSANADISISRLSFDQARWPKRFPKLPELPPLPPITGLLAKLTTDGSTLDLEKLNLRLAGQPVTAAARFTLDKNLNPKLETLNLNTDADLSAFAEYSRAILAPRGRIEISIDLAAGKPIEGRLQLHSAALRPLAPFGVVHSINADARLAGRRLEITTATALIGNQPATLEGTVEFPEPAENAPFPVRPDLTLKATNIPFARQPGLLVRGDLDLRINTSDTATGPVPRIQGAITLRDSLFLADLRSLWATRPASGPASRPPFFAIDAPPLDKWLLDINVRGNRFLRINTTVFTGRLSADFKLDGTLGDPRLTGDANIDNGRVLLPFANFTTQNGRVRLTKASSHMPSIEFSATSRTLGYDLRMDIAGTLDNPRLIFTSSPALTSEQILLFVMAGETPNSGFDYTDQKRALSLGTYLGQGFVNEIFGISNEEGRLTLTSGEKLTRHGRETYNVEYKLADLWTAVGEYDEFDAYNLGLKWLAYRGRQPGDATEPKKEKSPATSDHTPPALKISGLGFWRNLGSKRMLQRTLSIDSKHSATFTANEIEDAAFLLISQLVANGHMHPRLKITVNPAPPAAPLTFTTNETLDLVLPLDLAATKAHFQIDAGIRYRLREVAFTHTGASSITDDDARQFFLPTTSLFGDKSIPYSPAALRSAVSSLQEALRQQGYAKASVTLDGVDIDNATGRVSARININQGPLWKIETLAAALATDTTAATTDLAALNSVLQQEFVGNPWSQWMQQDIAQKVRRYYYRQGYPDVAVQVTSAAAAGRANPPGEPSPSTAPATTANPAQPEASPYPAELIPGTQPVAVRVAITPGPQVRIGQIRITGNRHTRFSLVERRIRVQPGDPLNPLAIESARHYISRLGAFRSIDVDYDPPEGDVRDAIFRLAEYPQSSLSLLLGWGSYEQLRGGFEVRRLNTFGIADQTRLQLVQSMKSTNGDLTFSLPDLFARGVNGSFRAFGLRREEIAFVRKEYGGTVTLRRAWPARGYEVSTGYTYESLNSSNDTLSPEAGETAPTKAATININIGRDRRDNPLSPKKGYNWYLQGEFASHYLGGETDYQRYRAGFNYHTPWGRTRWIHAGVSQGIIRPIGDKNTLLPVNKLFYPGGENSIRGYQDGEAAPRDETGAFLGAKVYTLVNLEIEQALIGRLNFVVFYDLLGASARLTDYPGNEWLNSAGIGIRYHTILGPLRLEYGRNLNPRTGDPKGTLHFSIGIPF